MSIQCSCQSNMTCGLHSTSIETVKISPLLGSDFVYCECGDARRVGGKHLCKGMTEINYYSVGKTVGIYVYVNGEKQLFTLESNLREQIAQEIEAMQRYETMMDGTTEKYSTGELLNRDEVLQAIRGK